MKYIILRNQRLEKYETIFQEMNSQELLVILRNQSIALKMR